MLLCLSQLSDMQSAQHHNLFRAKGGAVLRSGCMGGVRELQPDLATDRQKLLLWYAGALRSDVP